MAMEQCRDTPRALNPMIVGASPLTFVFFNSARTPGSPMFPLTDERNWRRPSNDATRLGPYTDCQMAENLVRCRHRRGVASINRVAARLRADDAFLSLRLSVLDRNGTRINGYSVDASHSRRQVGNADPPYVRGRLPDATIHGDPSNSGFVKYSDTLPVGAAGRGAQREHPD